MPIVKIELFAGRSDEQKARLAKAITQQFVEQLALNRPGFSRHLASSLRDAFQTLPVTADC